MVVLRIAALSVATLFLLWVRRPDQFTHPYIWGEEGKFVLTAFAERGWASFFEPLQGYLILVLKLILLPSFALGFGIAPWLAMIGAMLMTVATVLAIALSPTHLRWPWLCAMATLLIPIGSEPYGLALMTFWWAGLLIILALLWREDKQWLRLGFIVFGGLSAPIIIPLAGVFVLRAAIERTRANLVAAAVALAVGALQFKILFGLSRMFTRPFVPPSPSLLVGKFVGFFYVPWTGQAVGREAFAIAAGFAALALIAAALLYLRARISLHFWLLALAMLAIEAVTLPRVDLAAIYPTLAGPRYFFYPFILLSWLTLWIAQEGGWRLRSAVALSFVVIVWQSAPHWRLRHVPIDWRAEMARCAQSETYSLPVHIDGRMSGLWRAELTGEQCRRLLR